MPSVFDAFSHPYQIRALLQETPFYSSEGVQTFPTVTSTVITGHVTTYSRTEAESEWRRGVAGVLEEGDVRLFTETVLTKGQKVEVDRTATPSERFDVYRVMSLVREHHLVARMSGGTVRREYLLREIPTDGPVIS